jgi:hypothetical protein
MMYPTNEYSEVQRFTIGPVKKMRVDEVIDSFPLGNHTI